MTDFERSWARFRKYHEVNGLRPTLDRWRRWLAAESRRNALGGESAIPSESVVSMVVVAALIVGGALGAGVAYVFERALCGDLQ